jgi:hypothetical protein
MPTYNFKREAQVYVVSGNSRHRIDVTDVSFNQTFSEESYAVKTLHTQSNVFEGSIITKANPANFSLDIPALIEADYNIIETLLINATSFDLYIKTEADVFKLENAVITNGSFVIERSRPLSIQIQGEAAKLTRGATLAGSLQDRSSTKNFNIPILDVTVDSSPLNNIVSITVELQNSIEWTPYTTLHGSLPVTSSLNSMYPSGFSLSKKILAGSITQYLTDGNTSNTLDWKTDASIFIKAGNGLNHNTGLFKGFLFGPATCTFTNRVSTGASVYTQSYDWRMVENPTNLADKLKYETD